MDRQKIKSNFEWNDNSYEVGLFTFYRENASVETYGQNRERAKPDNDGRRIKRQSKSEVKIDNGRNYITQYPQLSHRKTNAKLAEPKRYELPHYNQVRFIEQPVKEPQLKISVITPNAQIEKTRKIRMVPKNNYLNSYFKYDINRTRKNMFIFRGDYTNLYSRFHESLGKSHLKGQESRKELQRGSRNNKAQTSRRVQTISFSKVHAVSNKPRSNILDFLLERKSKGISHYQTESVGEVRSERVLGRFLRYKKPNHTELSSILKN